MKQAAHSGESTFPMIDSSIGCSFGSFGSCTNLFGKSITLMRRQVPPSTVRTGGFSLQLRKNLHMISNSSICSSVALLDLLSSDLVMAVAVGDAGDEETECARPGRRRSEAQEAEGLPEDGECRRHLRCFRVMSR